MAASRPTRYRTASLALERRAVISSLLRPAPLAVGAPAPELSLTADDGTWVRSDDHRDRAPIVLVFFSDPEASADELRKVEAARPKIEAAGAKLFGISHIRLDRLRAARAELGLGFLLLYDLLAAVTAGAASGNADANRAEVQVPQKRDIEARDVDWGRVDGMIADKALPYVLVDVRTPDEFDAIHHPKAWNIPVEELPNRINELPAKARVLCVCQTGGRATATVGFLVSAGFTEVFNVKGGMAIWPGVKA
jgi:rhodanese-related sulfurtransferase/peroxiredoxin